MCARIGLLVKIALSAQTANFDPTEWRPPVADDPKVASVALSNRFQRFRYNLGVYRPKDNKINFPKKS